MSLLLRACVITLSLWVSAVSCGLISSLNSLSAEYDFIIVGAGTAGNVLARRLTEVKNITVLVVEAGISNEDNLALEAPFLGLTLAGTSVDWNFTTTPQPGLNGRSIELARGFVLGGSSSINYMAWTRGSNDMWNNWASLTGDSGWSWSSVERYYKKSNTLVAPADGHNTTGQVDPAAHGFGPLQVSVSGHPTVLDPLVVNASNIAGDEFFFVEDINDGNSTGFSFIQSTVGGGVRSSSATAYLSPVLSRSNLDVIIQTRAIKLLSTNSSSSKLGPKFTTVVLAQSPNGPTLNVKARKEIILAGGAAGTPHLLLLSGVGPKSQLNSFGIKPVVESNDVGQHLVDHPLVPVYYSVNSTSTFDDTLRNTTLLSDALTEWITQKEGLLVSGPGNTFGFLRHPDGSSILSLNGKVNPASGPGSANMEMIIIDGFAQLSSIPQPATGHYVTIAAGVVSPTSSGALTLNSTNPFVAPNLNPSILSSSYDIAAMVQVIRETEKFMSLRPWKGFVGGLYGDLASATTDAQITQYVRNYAITIDHMAGTARMSPTNATSGVTDSRLKVKGAQGLRIVDASVFPKIPECHTQAVVYTLAERAADLIKIDNGLPVSLI